MPPRSTSVAEGQSGTGSQQKEYPIMTNYFRRLPAIGTL